MDTTYIYFTVKQVVLFTEWVRLLLFQGNTMDSVTCVRPATPDESSEGLEAELAPILLGSTLTLQEGLANAEILDRLSNTVRFIAKLLPIDVVDAW